MSGLIAKTRKLPFETEKYSTVRFSYPLTGKHILAVYNNDNMILYHSCRSNIARHAEVHQTFEDCPGFSFQKFKYFRPGFFSAVSASQWGSKPGEEHLVALRVRRIGFEEICRIATSHGQRGSERPEGVLNWEFDHTVGDEESEREVLLVGLRLALLTRLLREWTVKIVDVTNFKDKQKIFVNDAFFSQVLVPKERLYKTKDENLPGIIQLEEDYNGEFEESED